MQKVSIIVPFYKDVDFIERCLLSIVIQTYSSFEIIMVDDCGHDGSIDVINRVSAMYPNVDIRVISHEYNKGQSAARNTGIANASGDYIFFIDADDTITPDCISVHVQNIELYNADFTQANMQTIGGKASLYVHKGDVECVVPPELYSYVLGPEINLTAGNKLYKKSFIDSLCLRFKEGMVYEDVVWAMELSVSARSIVFIPNTTYNYIIREGSTTTVQNVDRQSYQFDSWKKVFDIVLEYEDILAKIGRRESMFSWLAKYRLKVSLRILISNLNSSQQRYYYRLLNNDYIVQNTRGVMRIINSMPFRLFKVLFFIPYKFARLIFR